MLNSSCVMSGHGMQFSKIVQNPPDLTTTGKRRRHNAIRQQAPPPAAPLGKDRESLAAMTTPLIGTYRTVQFRAGAIDPVSAEVDLLIVGMPELSRATQVNRGVCTLDAALAGTLSHLRAGGLFDGRFGETMILSSPPPPVRCRSLLIVGMGDIDHVDPDRLGRLATIAMRAALQLDSCTIASLINLLDPAAPAERLCATARAMMNGVLKVIDSYPASNRFTGMDWTFDLRADHAELTAHEFSTMIAQWPATG